MRRNLEIFHASHVLPLHKMGNVTHTNVISKERGVKRAYRLVEQRSHKYTLEIKNLPQITLNVSIIILDSEVSFNHQYRMILRDQNY